MNILQAEINSDRKAHEVLDILDRWDERLQGHHAQLRNHERKKYRSKIEIYLSRETTPEGQHTAPQNISAWCRNISQGGLSFIYPSQLKLNSFILCLNPDAEETLWYHAQVTRSRQVHNGFWEYGVKLLDRAQV